MSAHHVVAIGSMCQGHSSERWPAGTELLLLPQELLAALNNNIAKHVSQQKAFCKYKHLHSELVADRCQHTCAGLPGGRPGCRPCLAWA